MNNITETNKMNNYIKKNNRKNNKGKKGYKCH